MKQKGKGLKTTVLQKTMEFGGAFLFLVLLLGTTMIPGDQVFDAYKDETKNFIEKL